jgi:hypothetical protein
MKFLQIDTKLSKYFEILLNINSRQSILSRATKFNGFGSLVRDGNNFFFDVFIPKYSNNEPLKQFFPLADVQERQRYYVSRELVEDIEAIEFINGLDSINGLVISYAGIETGNIVIKGFMHQNAEIDFSDLLSGHSIRKSCIAKVTLKPTMGFLDFMNEMNVKLKNIIISLPIKEFAHYRVIKLLRDTGGIGQFADNYPLNGSFRLMIYCDRDLSSEDGIQVISSSDHVYETKTDEDILLLLASKAKNNRISWSFMFIYVSDDKLFMSFILPEYRAREYFQLIVDTEMDLKKLDWVTLESYSDFGQENIDILMKST